MAITSGPSSRGVCRDCGMQTFVGKFPAGDIRPFELEPTELGKWIIETNGADEEGRPLSFMAPGKMRDPRYPRFRPHLPTCPKRGRS